MFRHQQPTLGQPFTLSCIHSSLCFLPFVAALYSCCCDEEGLHCSTHPRPLPAHRRYPLPAPPSCTTYSISVQQALIRVKHRCSKLVWSQDNPHPASEHPFAARLREHSIWQQVVRNRSKIPAHARLQGLLSSNHIRI